MDETELPSKEDFYSKLSESHISDEEYQHAQQVWSAFDCQTFGDYHDLYMLTDVLLLADVFESFRDLCLDYYGLDPAHYFTTPNFAWDAMLKMTGKKLDLLTDYEQYRMVEQGLRGGIAMLGVARLHYLDAAPPLLGLRAVKPSAPPPIHAAGSRLRSACSETDSSPSQ